eukprot:4212451-Amphidinium_carterae.1
MPSLTLANCVFPVVKLWRILSTLCIIVLLGLLRGVRLHFRLMPVTLLLESSCMGCCLLLKGMALSPLNRLWFPGLVFTLCGLMGLADTIVISTEMTFAGGVGNQSIQLSFWPRSEDTPQKLVSDCKGLVSCLHALRAGQRQLKGRHRDLESRALAGSEKDADKRRVARVALADVAANQGTSEHVPLEPSEKWKQCSIVCQAVRNFWLLVGPKLRVRLEQWPRVRLPAQEPEPMEAESAKKTVFPAAPFVMVPHQCVVEHDTYAIRLDCERHVG